MKTILNKQIIILTISIVLFAVASGILASFIYGMNQRISKVLVAKEQLVSYEEGKKIFAKESEELNSISQNADKFESYIVNSNTTPDFLSRLELLANEKKVDFTITAVQTPDAGTPSERLIIDFSATGTNLSIEDFLYALKHQKYQVQILKVSLSKTSQVQIEQETSTPEQRFIPKQQVENWELFVSMQIMSY